MANPQHLAIDAYLKELTELAQKRSDLDRRTARVEKAVRAMIDLLDGEPEYEPYMERFDDVTRPAGLTSAIRALLQASGSEGLTPLEVRGYVQTLLVGHSNPLASVHTILKRLVKTDSFEKTTRNGEPAYRWVSTGELMVRDMQLQALADKANASNFGNKAQRKTLGQRIAESGRTEEKETVVRNKDFPQRLGTTVMPRNTK